MPTITNKTRRPLTIPLPGGKKLRLGPLKSGEITPKATEHPPVVGLVEAGEIEIGGGIHRGMESGGAGKGAHRPTGRRDHGGGIHHVGDR